MHAETSACLGESPIPDPGSETAGMTLHVWPYVLNGAMPNTPQPQLRRLQELTLSDSVCGLLVSAAGKAELAFHPAVRGRAREFFEREARLAEVGFRSAQHKPD